MSTTDEASQGERDKAKNVRQAAKGKFTRGLNAGRTLINARRSIAEVTDAVKNIKEAYDALTVKHNEYTMFLNDDEYKEAEKWMNDCTGEYTEFIIYANDYEKENCQSPTEQSIDTQESNSTGSTTNTQSSSEQSPVQKIAAQNQELDNSTSTPVSHQSFVLKHEKPKLPQFNGDVHKYFIFKADFQHAIQSHCSERDAITILRSCLGPEPSRLVEGISTDLEAAWRHLDQNYGDPRIISDTITTDLEKFKVIQEGEDNRLCDLVNLVRRSYNILKEIKRPQDINNSHVIVLIKRKMTKDDVKVWARYVHVQKIEASMENLLQWMEDEMTARMRSGATIRKVRSLVHTVHGIEKTGGKTPCYVCKDKHYVDECPKFVAMSVHERWKLVKEQKACFSCLKRSKGHTATNCLRKKECQEKKQDGNPCKKPHHRLLHTNEVSSRPHVGCVQDDSHVLLPTLIGKIMKPNNELSSANIFYDSGAQVSIVRSGFAESLNLESKPIKIAITTVGGVEEEMSTRVYKVPVCTRDGRVVETIQAVAIRTISEDTPVMDLNQVAKVLDIPLHNLERRAGPVDLLIGVNYSRFHTEETQVKNNLVARNSPLGWVVFGSNVAGSSVPDVKRILHIRAATPVDLTSFWDTESMGVSTTPCTCEVAEMSTAEREVLKEIEQSCKLHENKWTMKYPWKKDPTNLPNNYTQVLKKLESTERRFAKEPEYASRYDQQIKEMEELNFVRKLSKKEEEEWKGPVHYISHQAVIRPQKKTTPVRVVFNGSASFNGHRLNDYWHKGPNLLNNLFGVLLRFRENAVGVSGDITKMYHMVNITPPDQHVHRFLWRGFDTNREPDKYVKTVLTFGDRPAPTMAITAMRKTANMNKEEKPEATESINKNAYVDDICDSTRTTEEAKALTADIDEVLKSGGFHVKKWVSNREINADSNHREVTVGGDDQSEKVLGIVWSPQEDKFGYKIKDNFNDVTQTTRQDPPDAQAKLTKRKILSKLAGIFDPIGAAAAVLIKPKIAMQELWQHSFEWDEEVPPDVQVKWQKLFQDVVNLNKAKFGRCLTPPELDGQFEVRFVAAKSRVAPLKELTIPRLELQAAVLASRLGKTILSESRLPFEKVIYFTDSRVVLAWIRGQPRSYKPFVSCRVSEIQSNSQPDEWFHCPTNLNVADDVSKGITSEEMSGRWLNGPGFLKLPENHWPLERGNPDTAKVNKERRKVRIACTTTATEPIIKCEDFSKWRKL